MQLLDVSGRDALVMNLFSTTSVLILYKSEAFALFHCTAFGWVVWGQYKASDLAGLTLKPIKCVMVPLVPFSEALVVNLRAWLSDNISDWGSS